MAVAAFAAVVSLMHVLDQIQQHPSRLRLRLHLDKDQIETLREKVSFLQDFLEVHSPRFNEDLEGLARQIAAVAVEAEDIIDAHVLDQPHESDIDLSSFWKLVANDGEDTVNSLAVDQLHKGSADKNDMDLSFSCEGIDNVIEKIDSIKKELMMIEEGMTIQELGPRVSSSGGSSAPSLSGNNAIVGFDEHLNQIIDELTGDKCDLQVLPIVGMGGIGKTTLARNAFDNSYIMRHFDIRTWLTVSQEYSMRENLIGLLKGLGVQKFKESDKGLAELGKRLYQILYDRRFLVVIDDVWNIEVWNDLRSFFPNNSNGSRIIVTTRLSPVAVFVGSQEPYKMNFLDKDKSWDLLRMKTFAKDGCCPPELEKVGKSIAKSCKGLPLAIIVIGGLLSKSNMTREYWEYVAKDVNSFANSGNDEHCLKILSLSYNHLPIHLKPCFLYMRFFPEDCVILVNRLILLWVAEGFLKPMKDKTLEEVAEKYLEDLISRNLNLMCKLGTNAKIKRCRMHDLLRDLCIRESENEHFYRVPRVQTITNSQSHETRCFLCCSRKGCTWTFVSSQPRSLASLVCNGCRINYPQLNKSRFVKVLDTYEDILLSTKLRHLDIKGYRGFVPGNLMCLLWQLHTLVIPCETVLLPSEIWGSPQLRHLACGIAILPDPSLIIEVDRKDSTIILKNLHTIRQVRNFRWSENAIERIPNLKHLGIFYGKESDEGAKDWSYYSLHNLGHLHKLESLFLHADLPYFTLKKNIAFPHSLRKLSLLHCKIPWEEMTIIGSLPNLEVLKLQYNAFKGPNWNPIEGEFLRLKKLRIYHSDLVHWRAEKVHFPNLERLTLEFTNRLKEFPLGIGEIETLRTIRLMGCVDSVNISAKEILEEQHSYGNEDLQLYVNYDLVSPGSG